MIKGNLSGAPNSRVLDFSLIRLEAAKMIAIPDYERLPIFESSPSILADKLSAQGWSWGI